MRTAICLSIGLATMLLLPSAGIAGQYQKELLAAFDMDDKGEPIPIPRDAFLSLIYKNKRAEKPDTDEGKELRESIQQREAKSQLSPEQKTSIAADLLRLYHEPANVN